MFVKECVHGGQHNELCQNCQLLIDIFEYAHGILDEKKGFFNAMEVNKMIWELTNAQDSIYEYAKFHQRYSTIFLRSQFSRRFILLFCFQVILTKYYVAICTRRRAESN